MRRIAVFTLVLTAVACYGVPTAPPRAERTPDGVPTSLVLTTTGSPVPNLGGTVHVAVAVTVQDGTSLSRVPVNIVMRMDGRPAETLQLLHTNDAGSAETTFYFVRAGSITARAGTMEEAVQIARATADDPEEPEQPEDPEDPEEPEEPEEPENPEDPDEPDAPEQPEDPEPEPEPEPEPTPIFSQSGSGADVFNMPPTVERVRITGTYTGSCENFIVKIDGDLLVNEILGTCSIASGTTYSGTHLTSGGVVQIQSSTGISWTFTEVR